MGIRSVAVHSTADRDSLHVRFADEKVCIGPPPRAPELHNVPSLINAAEVTGATPSTRATDFWPRMPNSPRLCRKCGLRWIGPSA